MDYAHRQRIKIWGEAKVVEGDANLLAKLMPSNYQAKPEQVMVISVTAWDANCPQHIPVKFDAATVKETMGARDQRIQELEAELARLQFARL